MTTVNIDQERLAELVDVLTRTGVREPDIGGLVSDPTRVLTWTPDLTVAEQSVLRAALGAVHLTATERTSMQSDIDLLVTFAGLATPTLVQTVAAVKAQSRILKAILRS